MAHLKAAYILVLASVLLLSCGDQAATEDGPVARSWGKMKGLEKIVGNMSDASYSRGRTQEPRTSASGKPVHMTDFEGKYVWAEYAAPW